ncbi:MAG: hypothetical protein R3C19_19915 [Planctomycetaceae bacterium]
MQSSQQFLDWVRRRVAQGDYLTREHAERTAAKILIRGELS